MAKKNAPQNPPVDLKNIAKTFAMEACESANLGEECVFALRAILRAIMLISVDHKEICELALVGANLADEHYALIFCTQQGNDQALAKFIGDES